MEKNKENSREVMMYLIFGVLATVVYIVTRFFVLSISNNNTFLALCVAQAVTILFAFITNKFFVFNDAKSDKNLFVQFLQFLSGRLLGWALDFVISYICIEKGTEFFVKLCHLDALNYHQFPFSFPIAEKMIGTPELVNQFFWTMVIQVLIIVMNYLISKFIVFNAKDAQTN